MDLLTMEEEFETIVDLKILLFQYLDYVKQVKIGKNFNRTILLKNSQSLKENVYIVGKSQKLTLKQYAWITMHIVLLPNPEKLFKKGF